MSEALDRLPITYLMCRSHGHPWEPYTVTKVVNQDRKVIEYRAELQCPRCTTHKFQVYDPEGGIRASGYYYAPGYLKRSGEEPITIRSARVESFNKSRLLTSATLIADDE